MMNANNFQRRCKGCRLHYTQATTSQTHKGRLIDRTIALPSRHAIRTCRFPPLFPPPPPPAALPSPPPPATFPGFTPSTLRPIPPLFPPETMPLLWLLRAYTVWRERPRHERWWLLNRRPNRQELLQRRQGRGRSHHSHPL